MTEIPKDPIILLSWVNLKLRDYYSSLDLLCDDLHIDRNTIEKQLNAAGFVYNEELNKFW